MKPSATFPRNGATGPFQHHSRNAQDIDNKISSNLHHHPEPTTGSLSMSVADITASLQKYEEIIREAVGNGSILDVMSMHRKDIVCVHLLFLSSFLTLHILVKSIQAFQDR
jgi:hypothetical protein